MQIQCTGRWPAARSTKLPEILAKRRNEDIRVAVKIKGFANISAGRTLVQRLLDDAPHSLGNRLHTLGFTAS